MNSFFKSIFYFFEKFFIKHLLYKTVEEPIVIKYSNDSDEEKRALLFGWYIYCSQNNFGNVSLKLDYIKGKEVLDNLFLVNKDKVLIINKIRLFFKKEDRQFYITRNIVKTNIDMNGVEYNRSVVPINCVDSYQSADDIIDVSNFKFDKVDGCTTFSFGVEKKSSIIISVYLLEEIFVGYFERKKILKKQDAVNMNNSIIIQQINPSFSLITYIKGLFKIKKYIKL